MTISHAVLEGIQLQGSKEQIAYLLTTTAWGSSPASPSNTLYDITDPASWTDVSATKLTGAASVLGDIFTSKIVTGLVAGRRYRLEFIFTCSGNVFEAFVLINCEA